MRREDGEDGFLISEANVEENPQCFQFHVTSNGLAMLIILELFVIELENSLNQWQDICSLYDLLDIRRWGVLHLLRENATQHCHKGKLLDWLGIDGLKDLDKYFNLLEVR